MTVSGVNDDSSQKTLSRKTYEPRRVLELALRIAVAAGAYPFYRAMALGDVGHYHTMATQLFQGHAPYRDFLWEYPPLSIVVLLLVFPAFKSFAVFSILFVGAMVITEFLMFDGLRKSLPTSLQRRFTWNWHLLIFPIFIIGYYRFDPLLAAVGAVALYQTSRNRSYVWTAVVGFGLKLWPIIYVGVMAVQKKWKSAIAATLLIAAMTGAWWAFSPKGIEDFLKFRSGAGFQVESIPGTLLLFGNTPATFEFNSYIVRSRDWDWFAPVISGLGLIVPALAVLIGMIRAPRNLNAFVCALILSLIVFSRIISPQYLIWIVPMISVMMLRSRFVQAAFGLTNLFTLLELRLYRSFLQGNVVLVSCVTIRNAALIALLVFGFHQAFFGDREDCDQHRRAEH